MNPHHPLDRRLSLLTPSGRLTLGNLLGALRGMAAAQDTGHLLLRLSDLHAMTVAHDPATLAARTREMQTLLLACGLDPDRATLFRQSRVPAHTELAYLLECTAYVGELGRMIQYKEKGQVDGVARPQTRTSLLTYPVLMAADILLYRPSHVPVGDDQRQHVELTRDLAMRFNRELRRGVHGPGDHGAAGRRAGDGPAGPDPEDEQVGPGRRGRGVPARRAGRGGPQGGARRHRQRHRAGRRPARPGREAGREQPAGDPRGVHRRPARRGRRRASRRTGS